MALTVVFLSRCANIVTPPGGPKDEKQPVVMEASPANGSTNFSGKSIHISFDEFIALNNASNNILISPPLTKKPTYRTSGKTLVIKFNEPLKPATTYSINFGDAIKDLHEGNILTGYSYIFSTGDDIDTLSLKGHVTSASTLKPVEGYYVGLYTTEKDTVTFDYVTVTDKKGNFELSGLADNDYHIFVLKDNNSNLIYDLPNEEIGFYPESVRPYSIDNKIVIDTLAADSIADAAASGNPVYEIVTFVQEDSIQKLFKKELVEAGLLRFVFRYPADNVQIKVLEELPDTFDIMPVYSARRDTVLWYFTPNKDSLWLSINCDTLFNDTIHFSLKPREAVSKKRKKQAVPKSNSLSLKTNLKNGKLKPDQPLTLSFSEPVTKLNIHDTTWFIVDQDTIFNDLSFTKADQYGFKYSLDKTFEPEKRYQIIIPDSTFFAFRGATNDTTRVSFSLQEESTFGNIFLTVEVPDGVPQVIVELLTDSNKTVDTQIIKGTEDLAFEYLDPGKYQLKAILDMDGNGVWSPGNFKKKLQPEKVVFYNGTLEVRANWDIDLDEPWKIEK